MFKPAILDTEWIRPIDPQSETLCCVSCLGDSARWILGRPDSCDAWCAHCVLYKTEWGRENAESIGGLVEAVEESIGKKISSKDGRVISSEAHRILGAIAASSRLYSSSRKRQ